MFPKRIRDVLSIWSKFTSRQTKLPDVDPLVARSWQRCLPRLNPHQEPVPRYLNQKNLLSAQSTHFEFISVARPIIEDIYQYLEASGSAILLANSAGYVLDMVGDLEMLVALSAYGFKIGVLTAEEQLGTNAFALALIDRVPARVSGPEHFLKTFHGLSDAAAPIFDLTGRPLGALGVMTEAGRYDPYLPGLVVAGARAIEAQLQSDVLMQEQTNRLNEINAIMTTLSDGILVLDAKGRLLHTNPAAEAILELDLAALVGRQLDENLQLPEFILEAMSTGQTMTNVDTTLASGEKSINCLLSLQFAETPNQPPWVIISLKEARAVREMIQHQIGPQIQVKISDFAGTSRQIIRMRAQSRAAAPARACVLIRGESGTGKDYLARALHNASPRRDRPFVIFGCSSVPSELVISELIGFEQGPAYPEFAGKPSKFELAHGGTLFFQDIEVLPREAQALLLNVLELAVVERLGSARPFEVDVRIIASTTANLERMVADGHFRADLYYRLSTFEIEMPLLRQRPGDLPILADRILERLARQHNRPLSLSPGALASLQRYHWPGNYRELEAALEGATIQAGTSEILDPAHLPQFIRHAANQPSQHTRLSSLPSLEMAQRDAIIQAARACNGNVTQMAKVLGISRTTVWRKLRDLEIAVDKFRPSGVLTQDGSN